MMHEYKYESQRLAFSMPYSQVLRIFRLSTFEIDGNDDDYIDIDSEAEIDGVIYVVRWNDQELPWHTKNHQLAAMIAMGCQWGAQQIFNMRYPNE